MAYLPSRRAFVTALGGSLLGSPLVGEAQQTGKVYRIAILSVSLPTTAADQGPVSVRLRELGWVYGRDFVVEYRAYGDRYERVPELAADLIRAGVDIFVVGGAADAARVQQLTRTIPIVTYAAGDLVAAGLAATLARPGGNVTGIQTLQPELAPKHLSLLKGAIPRLSRIGMLFHQTVGSTFSDSDASVFREAESGVKALRIVIQRVIVRSANELGPAFSAFHAERAQAVVIVRDGFMGAHLKTLVDLALKHRLSTISAIGALASQGGLISYGYNIRDCVRSATDIVDKIRRGATASEIPIQQAATFRLVINLKTARMLVLKIPAELLARADEVLD